MRPQLMATLRTILQARAALLTTVCLLVVGQHLVSDAYITYIEVKLPLKGTPPGPVSVWPLPQIWQKSDRVLLINKDPFNFVTNVKNCSVINNAINRYRTIIKSVASRPTEQPANGSTAALQVLASTQNLPQLNSVFVQVSSHECNYPQPKVDESYTISVGIHRVAEIQAPTVWGALRAMETFSQLAWNYHGYLVVNETEIRDWPRFSYRGMMLDTARHFIPKPVLMANLDAMAYNKLNVFHWHIVDDQSWPMESLIYPELQKQAYSPKKIYSIADILEIIEYARMRGIRVIPEIDTPGHTQSMGKAIPGILTPCYGEGPGGRPNTPNYPKFAAQENLNPIQDYTYQVVLKIIEEVKRLFPDPYVHLGMDEAYYDCWESNPEIRLWMLKNNLTSMKDLETFYVQKTIDNVRKTGYQTIIWQDPLDNHAQVPLDTVVEVWKDFPAQGKPWQDSMNMFAEYGNDLLLSACWYLNYISYAEDWTKYYQCEPHSFSENPIKQARLIGGEAAIWSEYVDGAKLLPLAWPRASAVAERLWSAPTATRNIDDARYRLDSQRCKMLERGIPANPVTNGNCPLEFYEEGYPLLDGRLRTWPN